MIEIVTLAREIAAALQPAAPYLAAFGSSAAKKAGEALPDAVKALWERLAPHVEAAPAAKESVSDLAAAPDDADTQAAFRVQLRKLLEADPALARDLSVLLAQAKPTGNTVTASGHRSVAIGGSANGATIVTGDGAVGGNKSGS
jgi:hypothetical protein